MRNNYFLVVVWTECTLVAGHRAWHRQKELVSSAVCRNNGGDDDSGSSGRVTLEGSG